MVRAVIFDMFETLVTHFDSMPYFCREIAADMGVEERAIRDTWDGTDHDRTIGRLTLEEVIARILRENGRCDDALFQRIVEKRRQSKVEVFRHLHPEILPMLEALKRRGVKIGLVSNCFSEERGPIRESALFPFFDAAMLSCEQGICKPDEEIFLRCAAALDVPCAACLYVGDGGSRELEVAGKLGMRPLQVAWYLRDEPRQPTRRMAGYVHLEAPMELLSYLENDF